MSAPAARASVRSRAQRPERGVSSPTPAPALKHTLDGIVHLLTCGSVDDGKSTLIGRLLWDASDLYDDQRDTLRRSATAAGTPGQPDFSLLVDGLIAEREQGITIDIAWRYFDTARRRYVVIDSPGHEQYTRNMASGASHADAAIMLIDARHGVKRQTRRHAAILDLVGVERVILAVNKMDLVDWSQSRFREIEADFARLTRNFRFREAVAVPVAARSGDNIARRSDAMAWYRGPTLLEKLDALPSRGSKADLDFRMPVQTVLKDGRDFRGLAGTIAAGTIAVGDEIHDALSARSARVQRIVTMTRDLTVAQSGQAVSLQLDIDLDIARGAVLSSPRTPVIAAHRIDARIVWLSDQALDTDRGLLLRTATDLVPLAGLALGKLLDLETLSEREAAIFSTNDIGSATIALARPVAVDLFRHHPETGSFVLVDALTGATVAGGIVVAAHAQLPEVSQRAFRLTRAVLASGICANLGAGEADAGEFKRRAEEVALVLKAAGVDVLLDI